MEKINQDFDKLTGLQTTSYVDEEGTLFVDYKQDIAEQFKAVTDTRNDGDNWRRGVRNSYVHALHIPDSLILELRKIGVDVYRHPFKDVVAGLRKIDRYEACDMTGKRLV
jgi:hypothetical protein